MCISWGHDEGSPRACSRQLKGVSRVPGRQGNQTGSVGPERPTLGTRTAERFGATHKVARVIRSNTSRANG
ncbi:UNVERIFIED_CONTAM: hypothetical protein Sradi_0186800 [Sesamum radiatum]|uniref:Uncharacterized protein n=1 Tax=Sesamum radiatum TaxID=300843 RepID=A0AAW2W0P3_SESRA